MQFYEVNLAIDNDLFVSVFQLGCSCVSLETLGTLQPDDAGDPRKHGGEAGEDPDEESDSP